MRTAAFLSAIQKRAIALVDDHIARDLEENVADDIFVATSQAAQVSVHDDRLLREEML